MSVLSKRRVAARKVIAASALAAATLSSGACATITRGSDTKFEVRTSPSGAEVQTSHGYKCTTPCSVKMPRKSEFQAKIIKPGYKTVLATVGNRISAGGGAGVAGNVLLGGGIGMGVDVLTGAHLDLRPNPLIVVLEPGDGEVRLSQAEAEGASESNKATVPNK